MPDKTPITEETINPIAILVLFKEITKVSVEKRAKEETNKSPAKPPITLKKIDSNKNWHKIK